MVRLFGSPWKIIENSGGKEQLFYMPFFVEKRSSKSAPLIGIRQDFGWFSGNKSDLNQNIFGPRRLVIS
jgi:hypothetical protein